MHAVSFFCMIIPNFVNKGGERWGEAGSVSSGQKGVAYIFLSIL
jgi:hypothetical protein